MTPFPVEPARASGPMRIVLTTYPSRADAVAAIDAALAARLAACAQTFPVESRYWWRGTRETAAESIVLFKTVPKRVGALVRFLRERHPYEVPELVELDVPRVDRGFLVYLGRTLDVATPEIPGAGFRRSGARRARAAPRLRRTRARPHRPSR